ncbi:MAG TPA: Spy/CpxP family protein refolding chaperone [Thermoanaerobaculia bacterium]|nr:Spy/CpxP family protein refolding chaperone [Thermoanaerobaculia bacterium]
MKKTITTLAVFALGASLAIAAPQAENGNWKGGEGHRGQHGFLNPRMAEKLGLSDAQKTQIRDIEKQFRADNKAFFESARATFQEYRAAKQSNDTAKLQQLQPTVDANKAQMKTLREAERAKLLTVLTAEQRAQLDAWRAAHPHKQP